MWPSQPHPHAGQFVIPRLTLHRAKKYTKFEVSGFSHSTDKIYKKLHCHQGTMRHTVSWNHATDNHTSTPPLCFLQAGCPSCHPTNSVKALKANTGTNSTNIYTLKSKSKNLRESAYSSSVSSLGGSFTDSEEMLKHYSAEHCTKSCYSRLAANASQRPLCTLQIALWMLTAGKSKMHKYDPQNFPYQLGDMGPQQIHGSPGSRVHASNGILIRSAIL